MGLPNGVHHLAIATRDMKGQIEFFTTVVGMELVALYWMHGVPDTMHGFLRLGDTCSLAFVQGPQMQRIQPQPGVSHAGSPAGPVAPGAMQHVALNVSSETDLLALHDRIRPHGYWIMGPIDHGMCKSMYLAAPEGIVLEVRDLDGPIDADRWIVGGRQECESCGRRAMRPTRSSRNGGAQPDHRTRPTLEFRLKWTRSHHERRGDR